MRTTATFVPQTTIIVLWVYWYGSEDPARADGWNWYVYGNNNPLKYFDPWGLESYVFYTSTTGNNFSKEAQWQKERLESEGEIVIMSKVNNVDDFTKAWNGMGMVDGKAVDINRVIIYVHGNERAIMFENGSSTNALTVNGKNRDDKYDTGNVNDLDLKDAKEVHLLSCNGGNLLIYNDPEKENLAQVFSQRVTGDFYAYDGNVSFGNSLGGLAFWEGLGVGESRLASWWSQTGFHEICGEYGVDWQWRNPAGKIKYNNGYFKPGI